jgi:uncharacterized membrane protein YfcA
MDPSTLLAISLAAVFAGAVAQAVTGMGFSLVAAPALIAMLGPREGVATVVLLAAMSSLLPLSRGYRAVRVRDTATLLLPTLAATPIIAALLAGADTSLVAVLAGLAVLAGVIALAVGVRYRGLQTRRAAVGTGVASAALNVVGGVGGPPIGLFVANSGWDAGETRASLQAFFLVQNIVTATVLGFVLPSWQLVAALAVGTLLGTWVAEMVPTTTARIGVLGVSGIGGLALVLGNV